MKQPLVIGYSLGARILHWLTAVAVLIALPLGVIAAAAPPGPSQGELFGIHKSFGVLVFIIVGIRVLHRLIMGVPGPHPQLPPLEKRGSQAVHIVLYILLIAIPLLGWLGTSAFGHPPSFFGLFTLPPLTGENKALGEQIMSLHVIVAFTFAALVTLHIVFALYHGFIRKDGVLERMMSGTNRGEGPA